VDNGVVGPLACGSFRPFGERNSATFDDRPHSAKRKNTTTMMGHNDLLRGSRTPPLLMAPGLSNSQKAVTPKDVDHLVGSEPRRAAITQPSPRPVSHFQAVQYRRVQGRVR
jgi:hypothetical protein